VAAVVAREMVVEEEGEEKCVMNQLKKICPRGK
jgi:hypothetical protein